MGNVLAIISVLDFYLQNFINADGQFVFCKFIAIISHLKLRL